MSNPTRSFHVMHSVPSRVCQRSRAISAGKPHRSRSLIRARGFTLIEILLTLAIVAVISGVVISQFTGTSTEAREAALRQTLHALRAQIELFKVQHNGRPPGFTGIGDIQDHFTAFSNRDGGVSSEPDANHPLGPYFTLTELKNPINGNIAVAISNNIAAETADDGMMQGSDGVGWFYEPAKGRIAANAEGVGSDGTPYIAW